MSEIQLGIIGAGNIAREHLKIIQGMEGVRAKVISSRTLSKAKELAENFEVGKVFDSIDDMVNHCELDGIMVLVSANQIFNVLLDLIPIGIPLFIEKPPGLVPRETKVLADLVENHGTKNMVGFNRRYYSIFHEGIKIIKENGKLLGLHVEGHERFWNISGTNIVDEVKENWLYANSIHTIDLLRLFGGEPVSIKAYSRSIQEKNGDQFVASMNFESGALGTYTSHWFSPGGWAVTLYGKGVTVNLKPLEKGIWIDTEFREHNIQPDEIDLKYKSGFYKQMEAFINMIKNGKLVWPAMDLAEALKTMELAKIFAHA